MYIYMCIYIYMYVYICIYICIYIYRSNIFIFVVPKWWKILADGQAAYKDLGLPRTQSVGAPWE